MDDFDIFGTIRSVGKAALCEQLAEEAVEVAKEALKCARILRDENPTPVKIEEAMERLKEEWTDICLCADVMKLSPNYRIMIDKLERWANRIEEARNAAD